MRAALWLGAALLAIVMLVVAYGLMVSHGQRTTTPGVPVTIADSAGNCSSDRIRYVVDDVLASGRLICVDLNVDPYVQGYQAYYDAPNQAAPRGGSAGCAQPYSQAIASGSPRLCVLDDLVTQGQ